MLTVNTVNSYINCSLYRTDLNWLANTVCSFSEVARHELNNIEPRHEKTNNVLSEQVRHKPACRPAVTEAG